MFSPEDLLTHLESMVQVLKYQNRMMSRSVFSGILALAFQITMIVLVVTEHTFNWHSGMAFFAFTVCLISMMYCSRRAMNYSRDLRFDPEYWRLRCEDTLTTSNWIFTTFGIYVAYIITNPNDLLTPLIMAPAVIIAVNLGMSAGSYLSDKVRTDNNWVRFFAYFAGFVPVSVGLFLLSEQIVKFLMRFN